MRFNELFDAQITDYHKFNSKNGTVNTPWIEKYRPACLKDIIHQEEVVKVLQKTLDNGNLPHLLFFGAAGCGKTSSILAIAMELFGPKLFKERVIELNASDERGINVVRNKIVTFAKISIGNADPKYPSPPYKIIILDEADAMTTEAQSALRKTMEDNSAITRFCFICNYSNKIIEPITSRCVKFRFKPINSESMILRLQFIANKEDMIVENECLKIIANSCQGDMRKAIMLLQNLKYINHIGISAQDVYDISGFVPQKVISKIEHICLTDKNLDIKKIIKFTKRIYAEAYPIHSILLQISAFIIYNKNISDSVKSDICIHISNIERRLIDGADEYLQLLSLILFIKKNLI